jgi:SMODS-associated and fused to various effectors sensor domain/HNH endonuclease
MDAAVSPAASAAADGDEARSAVVEVTCYIKPAVQVSLVARAAGRCQFRGCNEFLFQHPLTHENGNYSEKAHIVAFKERGPRGRDGDRPEDINSLSNLMLLCLRDHKHVDDNPAKYPRKELEKQKAEHEARMARLTALAPQMRSTVLTIKARIGGSLVEVGEHEVWQALYPRYPSERRPHVLDLTELGDEKAGAFYALAEERIRGLASELYATGSDLRATGRLSVLGLAPIPLLVLLGSCLSNKVTVDFFQCHRTRPDRFTWHEEDDVVRFVTRKLRDGTAPGRSTLLLSLSGQLGLGDVPSSIDPGAAVYEITLDGMSPDLGFLRRREDLEAFRAAYRALLASLRAEYPGRAVLHLLPAAPAPIALACGYDLLPKVDPDLVLYDNIKPHGFIERLKVKNHDRI